MRAHGGSTVEVRLIGNNYDEAASEAKRLEKEEGLALIHPFDDDLVIAGQGTIGEIFALFSLFFACRIKKIGCQVYIIILRGSMI